MRAGDPDLRIPRTSRLLRDRVTDVIREAILQGDLAPGRRLTERELGELTGVSRTSLREALRSLEAEGLVERSEGRGLRVATLSAPTVTELYDARAVLEPAAVEMFVRNATARHRSELQAAVGARGRDNEAQLANVREFYRALLAGTANPIMEQMFGSIEARIHSLRRLSLRVPGRQQASAAELREIADFIEKGDVERAADGARKHVLAAKAAALRAVARAADQRGDG